MNSLLTKTSMNIVTVLYNNTIFEPLTQNKGIWAYIFNTNVLLNKIG